MSGKELIGGADVKKADQGRDEKGESIDNGEGFIIPSGSYKAPDSALARIVQADNAARAFREKRLLEKRIVRYRDRKRFAERIRKIFKHGSRSPIFGVDRDRIIAAVAAYLEKSAASLHPTPHQQTRRYWEIEIGIALKNPEAIRKIQGLN